MKTPHETKLKIIRSKIKTIEEEHIVYNGFSIDDCGYDNCADRIERTKLRKKLREAQK